MEPKSYKYLNLAVGYATKFVASEQSARPEFVPGQTYIPPSGKVVGTPEVTNAIRAALEMNFTEGHWTDEFEEAIAGYVRVRYASLCNSGSSANLLALAAVTDPSVRKKDYPERPYIITAAAGFPTTVNPILQLGFTPWFVDVPLEFGKYVPGIDEIREAIDHLGPKNVVGIMLAHTLGQLLPIKGILDLCEEHNLFFVEDACDALGSEYFLNGSPRRTGSFGDVATLSMYPAHHITGGEGGVVFTNRPRLHKIIESFRDWGRDCWCVPGAENTCGKRFDFQLGDLPQGYDHKYIYSRLGYNMKSTDFQAAIALAQIKRLPGFVNARRENKNALHAGIFKHSDVLILPAADNHHVTSWFGYPITLREPKGEFTRANFIKWLEERRIGTRLLFGGNLLRQPAYVGRCVQNAATLPNSDKIARDTFWVGVYPGITPLMRDYMIESLCEFVEKHYEN
jgi:CDP-6-deoxy-D-xylo-4-hexulose-3-dehydrase